MMIIRQQPFLATFTTEDAARQVAMARSAGSDAQYMIIRSHAPAWDDVAEEDRRWCYYLEEDPGIILIWETVVATYERGKVVRA